MTEEEAKRKTCCGPRAAGLGEDIECIASACMAWRAKTVWHSQPGTIGRGLDKPDLIGYCGLAGSPQ